MIDPHTPGALSDTELEHIISDGWLGIELNDDSRRRIQPASFDPVLTDEAFLVPRHWTPDKGATLIESLRRLPSKLRQPFPLHNGGYISPNPDFSYLVMLDTTVTLPPGFFLRASPKSTEGRLGNYIHLAADGQTNLEEVNGPYRGRLAAIIEPRVFSSIIYPGLAVNQLRIFCGQDFDLDERATRQSVLEHKLLYVNGKPVDADSVNTRRGLEVHLDLEGARTKGLVGFRAIGNPLPIDRQLNRHYPIQNYFSAIEAPKSGTLSISPNDRLLILATQEDIRIPPHLAAELAAVTLEHGDLKWHEAGFFDPGFGYGQGELKGKSGVLEVYPLGPHGGLLKHGQGCGRFVFQPLRSPPRRYYGQDGLGSSYHDQIGAWFAKSFALPDQDLGALARELLHKKEAVMACPNDVLFNGTSDYFEGFASTNRAPYNERALSNYEFRQKEDVEHDPLRKQPIPYIIILNPTTQRFFVYQRARDTSVYSEERLHGKVALGVGGHIRETDAHDGRNPLEAAYERELREEVIINGNILKSQHVGYINCDQDDVSRVHFGLLYIIDVDTDDVRALDPEIREGRMRTLDEFTAMEQDRSYEVEAWAHITADFLRRYLKE